MDTHLPSDVQMQTMRPGQLEAALRAFPVIYVPFGLIEWHGRHLPLGNDALNMMAFYPDLVDLAALGDGPLAPDMAAPDGIGGLDPRDHASAEVGMRNVELASEAIGRKAQALLASLPEDQRSFNLPAISPEHWWQI